MPALVLVLVLVLKLRLYLTKSHHPNHRESQQGPGPSAVQKHPVPRRCGLAGLHPPPRVRRTISGKTDLRLPPLGAAGRRWDRPDSSATVRWVERRPKGHPENPLPAQHRPANPSDQARCRHSRAMPVPVLPGQQSYRPPLPVRHALRPPSHNCRCTAHRHCSTGLASVPAGFLSSLERSRLS